MLKSVSNSVNYSAKTGDLLIYRQFSEAVFNIQNSIII